MAVIRAFDCASQFATADHQSLMVEAVSWLKLKTTRKKLVNVHASPGN